MKRTIAAAVTIVVFLPLHAQSVSGDDLFAWVRGIEGRTHEGRRSFIEGELDKLGVRYAAVPFRLEVNKRIVEGRNIVVSLGKGMDNIVVGAHYDAVPGSPGANDNGGGVAVVLGLIRSLKTVDWKHRINFCFFDQEELGMIGSGEFVRTYKDSLHHRAMINLDVEGTGEEVYVGPVGGGDDEFLMPIVRKAAAKVGYELHENPHYPPSDQFSFAERKLENISISIVPKGDSELLARAEENGWQQIDPASMPRVMGVMHTPHDSSTYVTPHALLKSFTLVSTIVRLMNDK